MKRRMLLATLTGMLLSGSTSVTLAEDKIYIPIVARAFQHQFWQTVRASALKTAEELNVAITFEGPEEETQIDKQIDMLSAALAKKPAALALSALDAQAVVPLLQQAKDANIPVVTFDAGVDSDIPVSLVATDNVAAAALAADKMAELIGEEGAIALVVHDQVSRNGIDRRDGFLNRIKEAYPKINVVAVEYGDGNHLKSTEITKTILQAYPNIKGIMGANEGSAIGVINGVRESGSKVVIVGFDSGVQQKQAIRDGVMAGAITQNPVGIGRKTVETAVAAAKGEPVPKTIDTGFYWYDKTNIDDPAISAVLYD